MSVREQEVGAAAPVVTGGGKVFMLISANSDCNVEIIDGAGKPLEIAENVQGGFKRIFKDRFSRVKITSASTHTIKFGVFESGDAEYSRLTGEVSVTAGTVNTVQVLQNDESSFYDTLNNENTFAISYTASSAPASYAHIQLFNPALSGVNLLVNSLKILGGTGCTQILSSFNAAGIGSVLGTGLAYNKNLSNVDLCSAELRKEVTATALYAGATAKNYYKVIADERLQINEKGVVLIPPGVGIILSSQFANTIVCTDIEWIEKTIA